jgi:hypothetical protein
MKSPVQEFIAALREFRDSFLDIPKKLSALREAIEHQTSAVNQSTEAHRKQNGPQPVIRAELHVPITEQTANKRAHIEKKWLDRTKVLLEFLTLAAVIGYACEAHKQSGHMIESNKINREGLESVQRAFVAFSFEINSGYVIDPKTKKVAQWNFSVPVKNSGTTPTRNMVMHLEAYPSRDELPDTFPFPDTSTVTKQLIVLGPNQTTRSAYFGQVRPEAIEAVRQHKGHLYFYGWTTYNDTFPKTPQHVTKFCYELVEFGADPFTTKNLPGEQTWFNAWKHHNCADSECDKNP